MVRGTTAVIEQRAESSFSKDKQVHQESHFLTKDGVRMLGFCGS